MASQGGLLKSVERIKLEEDMKGAAIAVETKQGDSFIFVNAPEYCCKFQLKIKM